MSTDPPDSAEFSREIYVAAPPEVVFPFFTDPAKMIRWKGIEATLDPRPGGIYRVNVTGREVARGEYREDVPYRRVVFTWGWEGDPILPPGSSTVEVTLVPDGHGTLVRLRHLGLPPDHRASHAEGWNHYLPRLATAGSGADVEPDAWATVRK